MANVLESIDYTAPQDWFGLLLLKQNGLSSRLVNSLLPGAGSLL